MIDKNIVRKKEQLSTSSQNQTKTTTEPKQRSSDDHNSDMVSTNEVRANDTVIFFSILLTT